MKEDKGGSVLWKLPVARALQSMWAAESENVAYCAAGCGVSAELTYLAALN